MNDNSNKAIERPISELILAARNANNLTQTEFGKIFEPSVAQSTVARWEKGDLVPNRKHLPKIASMNNLIYEEFLNIVSKQYMKESFTIPSFNDEDYIFCKRHYVVLDRGVKLWNRWREKNYDIIPQLEGAKPREILFDEIDLNYSLLRKTDFRAKSLKGAKLRGADLSEADLSYSNLSHADLRGAVLKKANLTKTNLTKANLCGANLSEATLNDAYLSEANLTEANLSYADLSHADLRSAILNQADLQYAILKYCSIYGTSTWNIKLKGAVQQKLFISPYNKKNIYVNCLYNAILKSWEIERDKDLDCSTLKQIQELQDSLEKNK